LRSFPFMPLDVVRFRDSDFAGIESGEAFRCGMLLMCASWHQVPAASLPDDDAVLARLAVYGRDIKSFRAALDAGAMCGWIKCSDGRLYHPVVAEKALSAWAMRRRQSEAGRLGNARRWGKSQPDWLMVRASDPEAIHTVSEANDDAIAPASPPDRVAIAAQSDGDREPTAAGSDADRKGIATERKGEEDSLADLAGAKSADVGLKKRKARRSPAWQDNPEFLEFRRTYPKADTKPARTAAAWAKATRSATPEEIMRGLAAHRFAEEERYRPDPSKWLNDESWRAAARPLFDQAGTRQPLHGGNIRTGDGRVLTEADQWQVPG
jgi:hypothetical protein